MQHIDVVRYELDMMPFHGIPTPASPVKDVALPIGTKKPVNPIFCED